MPRLWYPGEEDVEEVASVLAAELFPHYDSPPVFQLLGQDGRAMLSSALALPRQPYYRTIYDKAGALLRSLIKNHPYMDGNKRMGMSVTTVFLMMNGHLLLPTSDEMLDYALKIAQSEPNIPWQEAASWIRENTFPLKKDPAAALAQVIKSLPEAEDVRTRVLRRWEEIERFAQELGP